MSEAREPALVAENLDVGFGRAVALTDVSVSVPAGASVALLGPNGAGKSTFFHAAVGLLDPRAGRIRLGSNRVAFVPQRLDLEPTFPVTVTDAVRMGRYGDLGPWPWNRFRDHDHRLVAQAISEVGAEHLADRRLGDLSSGERQRALLAQAVAQDADLLLLDEPFTGVDRPTHDAVNALLRRWRTEGRTVLVATHDLEAAADYDLVLCLNRRVVAFGPPPDVLTEAVLGETFAGRVVRVGGLLIDVAHHHHGAG
jgi:ABC-type Mn2+/Zn2+ transport system ATPase subunit